MTIFEWMKSDINNAATVIANIVDSPRIGCKAFCNYRNGGKCKMDCHKAVLEWLNKEHKDSDNNE